jgi:hypothetical protein
VTFWYGSGSGSVPRTNGSGYGWPKYVRIRNNGAFTSFFKEKKSSRSLKTEEIKVFLTIFAWWLKDPEPEPEPDPYLWQTDPNTDPGGLKTQGSYGSRSESETVIFTNCFAKAPFSHAHHYLEGKPFFNFRIFQPTWQNNLSRSWQYWWFVQVHDSASSAQPQNNAATPSLEELPAPGFWEIFHYGLNHAGLITGRI